MRYRIIANRKGLAVGGAANSAVEALAMVIRYEMAGHDDIVIKQEDDGLMTRADLIEAVEKEKNAYRA